MLMLYNTSLLLWKSKMQKITALLTVEAEYYLASTAAVDILYLWFLLENLGFTQQKPTDLQIQFLFHQVGE